MSIEVMKLALQALETKGEHHPKVYEAIAALRSRLGQAENKPVAWMMTNALGKPYFRKKPQDKVFNPQPVYTSPQPQEPLVGLTSDEIIKLIQDNGLTLHGDIEHFAALVEEHAYAKHLELPEPRLTGKFSITALKPIKPYFDTIQEDIDLLYQVSSADIEALEDAKITLNVIKEVEPGVYDEIIDSSLALIDKALGMSYGDAMERVAIRARSNTWPT